MYGPPRCILPAPRAGALLPAARSHSAVPSQAEGETPYVYEEKAMLAEKENSVWKVQEINIFKSINKYVNKKLNINLNIENSYLRV